MNIFQQAIKAGYSVIPCNGKIPDTNFLPIDKTTLKPTWKPYKNSIVRNDVAEKWTGNIAVICGKVSGGLTCIDFDVKNGDKFDEFLCDMNHLLPELLSKLYYETTPSHGYHVCFKSDISIKNKKLACNKSGVATIETRGEGGYFVCAPSENYAKYYGKLSSLNKITDNEAKLLIAVCESLNEFEEKVYIPKQKTEVTGDTVFNRYDSVSDPIKLLLKHGWKVVLTKNDTVYLRRPGKDKGISATWNNVPNRLYCFTTSTVFKPETPYKASAVYTFLEHGGNFNEAANALRETIFGKNNYIV
jgi:hypothetical protein